MTCFVLTLFKGCIPSIIFKRLCSPRKMKTANYFIIVLVVFNTFYLQLYTFSSVKEKFLQFYFQLIFRCDFLDCIVLGFPGRSNLDSFLLIIMVKNSSTLVVLFALLPHSGFCNCIFLVLLHIHFSAIDGCSVLIAQFVNAKCFFKRQRR